MDDFTTGIGNSNVMNDINNMNALAQQAANEANSAAIQASNTAMQMHNDAVRTQQPTGYSNSQSSSTGYSNSQNSYGSASSYNSSSSYSDYSSSTYYSDLGSQDTDFVSLIKGIIGALVGAIPGVLLIILLARAGFIAAACGALMAAGMILGYKTMTRNNPPSETTGILVCGIIMIIGVYIAVRTSWCMEISSIMQEYLEISPGSLTTEQSNILYEFYGVRDVSFSECSSNFWTMLDKVEIRGKFIFSLFENLIFAVAGGFGAFAKLGNSKF